MQSEDQNIPEGAIAIIGMACRFPGAKNISQFWHNLANGVNSITTFSKEELEDPAAWIEAENYVPARGLVADADMFDAPLFGLTPKEAGVMDPQQRLFLQTCLECLEDAGYDPSSSGSSIGLFAGSDPSSYEADIRTNPKLASNLDHLEILIGNGPGFFSTKVSYLLNLQGPSISVQTTCSTSLTAIHLACQSLLGFECNSALAGGCSIPTPLKAGHFHTQDGPLSPDGFCRAFDEKAAGTVIGSGAGAVLLKRLDDALRDGDHVYAIIRGSAFNNDGSAKVGFTAPSVEGQTRVIREAMNFAEIEPNQISFVETHGTGTKLGDPIEVEALRQAFGPLAQESVILGAVKTNIGHCNAAAGVAGVIKTALSIHHQTLVPTLNFEKPNPALDLEDSPFKVLTQSQAWQAPERIAGVSSFGLGGTNVHAILSQPPTPASSATSSGPYLLTLSAHTEGALIRKRIALQEYLKSNSAVNLADLTYTLNAGRKDWHIRQAISFEDTEQAVENLNQKRAYKPNSDNNALVFLFPGQGADYPDFGAALYHQSDVFKNAVDQCSQLLESELDLLFSDLLFSNDPQDLEKLKQPTYWQPAIFVCEYALAQYWLSQGLQPASLMGHSIGEYVGATLAGVFNLEDALKLIALRGRETQKITKGSMLAVIADEATLAPYLSAEVEHAAQNGPSVQVLAGTTQAIQAADALLKTEGIQTISLPGEYAFHSHLMEPVAQALRTYLQSIHLNNLQIPLISNLTGDWLSNEQAKDPNYWVQHTRSTVQFNRGLERLVANSDCIFLEVGPGQVLSKLVSRHPKGKLAAIASADDHNLLSLLGLKAAFGKLWEQGMPINWNFYYQDQQRQKLSLPTYPFDSVRYWILEESPDLELAVDPLTVRSPFEQWFYQPSWRQAPLLTIGDFDPANTWLVFSEADGISAQFAQKMREKGHQVLQVTPGSSFQKQSDQQFSLPFEDHQAYAKLLQHLVAAEKIPTRVIFELPSTALTTSNALPHHFNAIIHWAQAMDSQAHQNQQSIQIITRNLQNFGLQAPQAPSQATALGAAWVIPKEMPQLQCGVIDIDANEDSKMALTSLTAELAQSNICEQLVLRQGIRWEPCYQSIQLPKDTPGLQQKPLLVFANGLQPLGLALAKYFFENYQAKTVLLDRSFFPKPEEWSEWLAEQGENDAISKLICDFQALGPAAEQISIVQAQLHNTAKLQDALSAIQSQHGDIDGLFYLEAPMEPGLIQMKPAMAVSRLLETRIKDLLPLQELTIAPKLLLLFSENLAESGMGRAEQAGLHSFQDHFVRVLKAKGLNAKTLSLGTHQWEDRADASHGSASSQRQLNKKRELFGMTVEECGRAVSALGGLLPHHFIVSTRDYDAVLEQQRHFTAATMGVSESTETVTGLHARPDLSSEYLAPRNDVENLMAELWQSYFDIEAIGVDDNFFELGGHSLLAVQLLAKINDTFASQLTMQVLFDTPSIAGLSQSLAQKGAIEDQEDLEALLDEIEGLSEEELQALLEAETAS